MAYIPYNNLWESEFDGIVSKRDKLQDLNINHIKLEVHDTYKKDEKITTNFEAVGNEDVLSKGYLDSKLLKVDGHLLKLEKDYNDFKKLYNKQSVEDILIQRAVKTTIQIVVEVGADQVGGGGVEDIEDKKFIHVGEKLFSFETSDKVLNYSSEHAFNDIKFPFAHGKENIYFMLHHKKIPIQEYENSTKKSEYEYLYKMDDKSKIKML